MLQVGGQPSDSNGLFFYLDGTSIYLAMAAIFVAQATNTPLTWTQELTLLGVLLITSKGAAGWQATVLSRGLPLCR